MPGNHRKSHLSSLMEHDLDEQFCVGFQGENRQSFGSWLMSQAESFGSRLRDEKPQKAPRSGRHLGFLPHESSLHQDWVQELKMKVPFCSEGMLLSFISPTFSLPPRPSGSSPGSGAFICVLLPPWETPGLWNRATWQALSMAFTFTLLLLLLYGHPQAAAGKEGARGEHPAAVESWERLLRFPP